MHHGLSKFIFQLDPTHFNIGAWQSLQLPRRKQRQENTYPRIAVCGLELPIRQVQGIYMINLKLLWSPMYIALSWALSCGIPWIQTKQTQIPEQIWLRASQACQCWPGAVVRLQRVELWGRLPTQRSWKKQPRSSEKTRKHQRGQRLL